MSRGKAHQQKIRDYLKVPEHREELRRHLEDRQEHLGMRIGEAMAIVGVKASKLHHWEETDLFAFEHPRDKSSSQRLYSIRDIARLLIIKKLLVEKEYPLREIKAFIHQQENAQFINELIDEIISSREHQYSWTVEKRRTWAEEAFFWRIFVPRSLYLSLCLLLGQTPDSDIWLLLPLSIANINVQRVEQLSNIGEVLLGHCSNENPFFACIIKNPMLDLPKRYKVIPLEWLFKSNHSPAGAYILLDEKSQKRWKINSEGAVSRCTKRLLQLLQETQSHWKSYLQEGNDFMVYDAPEFKNATLGHQTMSQMAEQIVQLGEINDAQQQSHWHFCCVLLPPDEDMRYQLKQRRLVIQGQGGASPYKVKQTELSPDENSISMKAYHSGQIVYRPDIVDEEPDIALHEREMEIKSAIAVPIEGRRNTILGVLYIASRERDAFSKDDDLILFRIIGRIIAEQVITYQNRNFLADKISEMTDHPNIVDNHFEEFLLESDFLKHLEERLEQIRSEPNMQSLPDKESQTSHNLSFLSVNFSILNPRTSERDIKDLTRDFGRQIKLWMKTKSNWTQMYYMPEQYYLLLGEASLEETKQWAFDLQATLLQQHNLPERIQISDIRLHLGAISYTYDALQNRLAETSPEVAARVRITNILNLILNTSKDREENIIAVWQPQEEKFIYL